MGWKNWPYWLRGIIVFNTIIILVFALLLTIFLIAGEGGECYTGICPARSVILDNNFSSVNSHSSCPKTTQACFTQSSTYSFIIGYIHLIILSSVFSFNDSSTLDYLFGNQTFRIFYIIISHIIIGAISGIIYAWIKKEDK